MIDDTITLPVVCVVCIANVTAVYSAYIALAYLLKTKRALLACDQEEMVCDEESPRVEDNDPELPNEERPVVLIQDTNQVASSPSVSHPMKTRGILRKPQYSSTFNQEDLRFVSPLTIDEANELWNSFASCKSTPSPSVEMRGILRKPDTHTLSTGEQWMKQWLLLPAARALPVLRWRCLASSRSPDTRTLSTGEQWMKQWIPLPAARALPVLRWRCLASSRSPDTQTLSTGGQWIKQRILLPAARALQVFPVHAFNFIYLTLVTVNG